MPSPASRSAIAYLALVAFYDRPRTRWAVVYGVSTRECRLPRLQRAVRPRTATGNSSLRRHAPSARRDSDLRRGGRRSAGLRALAAQPHWVGGDSGETYVRAISRRGRRPSETVCSRSSGLADRAPTSRAPWPRRGKGGRHSIPCWPSSRSPRLPSAGSLWQKRPFSLVVAGALCLGTVLTGLFVSQFSPGFAPRTVSYAVLGWAILLGAAAAGEGALVPRRAAGVAVVAALMVISAASLQSIYQGDKQHWRDWAGGVAEAVKFGFPVVTFPRISRQPWSTPTSRDPWTDPTFALYDEPDLDALDSVAKEAPALWVASYDIASGASIDPFLRRAGFERAPARVLFLLALTLSLRSARRHSGSSDRRKRDVYIGCRSRVGLGADARHGIYPGGLPGTRTDPVDAGRHGGFG